MAYENMLWLRVLILFTPCVAMAYPDPTRPPDYSQTSGSKSPLLPDALTLTAVFIYPSYRIAIINNRVLKPGDQIGQYTVTTIDTNTVELVGPQHGKEILSLSPAIKTLRRP